MIIEFSVKNFRSFKAFSKLSMAAVKSFKEHQETHVVNIDDKTHLLKSVVIYGNNASGKSNLIDAIKFMKSIVLNSFGEALLENDEKKFPLEKFLLNSSSEKEPSFFEMVFIQNDTKYRYGFELDYNVVISEWLFHTTSKEVYLFRRENGNIEVNKSAFKEGLSLDGKTKDNVLFITLVAQLNGNISNQIISWFKKINCVKSASDDNYKSYTIKALKDDSSFLTWVNHFTKYLEISNLTTSEKDFPLIDFKKFKSKDKEIIGLLKNIQGIASKQPKPNKVITWHKKYDDNNFLIDTIPFDFDTQESEGTKKILYLLGPWYDSLRKSKVLLVDELDARLHSHLIVRLLDFFHEFNLKGAQLICTIHDTTILNKDIFRRDQIYFVEKDQFGASDLYSLADFKSEYVRNKTAFEKNYLEGKYGAIPYFERDEKLTSLLYEQ